MALLAAACADDTTVTTTASATSAPTTTAAVTTTVPAATTAATATASTTTTVATTIPFAGDTGPKSGPGTGGLLTNVRFGDHDGFTRIVFDFEEPALPGWEFRYGTDQEYGMAYPGPPYVAGSSYLMGRFYPSGTVDISDPVIIVPTYTGDSRIDVNNASVVQLLLVEDFEAQMWWVIGLSDEKPFSVGTLTGPPRIYVDIAD